MNCFQPHIERIDFHQEHRPDFERFQGEPRFYLAEREKDKYMQ